MWACTVSKRVETGPTAPAPTPEAWLIRSPWHAHLRRLRSHGGLLASALPASRPPLPLISRPDDVSVTRRADKDLCACKMHVDQLRRQRDFAIKAAEEAAEKERQAERELQAARERADDDLPAELPAELLPTNRAPAVAIQIGDGPTKAELEAREEKRLAKERAAAKMAKERAAAAPAKPAKWAAAEEGTNAKKGWNAATDKTGLEDCPICLEEPGDIEMRPCGHTCCGGCLDQWMSTKSSFASTLRAGSSDTTCPLCRQTVQETVAAKPTAETAAANAATNKELSGKTAVKTKEEPEVDWVALAAKRQAEVIAQARTLRSGAPAEPSPRASEPKPAPKPTPQPVAPPQQQQQQPAPMAPFSASPIGGAPNGLPNGAQRNGPAAAAPMAPIGRPHTAPGPVAPIGPPGRQAPGAIAPPRQQAPGPIGPPRQQSPGPMASGPPGAIGPPRQQSPLGGGFNAAPGGGGFNAAPGGGGFNAAPGGGGFNAVPGGFGGAPGLSIWGGPSVQMTPWGAPGEVRAPPSKQREMESSC